MQLSNELSKRQISNLNEELNKNTAIITDLYIKTPPIIVDRAKNENVTLFADRDLGIIYFIYCQLKTFPNSVSNMQGNCY